MRSPLYSSLLYNEDNFYVPPEDPVDEIEDQSEIKLNNNLDNVESSIIWDDEVVDK